MSAARDQPDSRPRAPKPQPGPLEQRVTAKPKAERNAECAKILAEAGPPAPWTFEVGKTTYTLDLPEGFTVAGNRMIVPAIRCEPAPPVKLDPPYVWVNPPIRVPDGTVRDVPLVVDTDEGPKIVTAEGPDGKPVEVWTVVENFKEDPQEAIRVLVADAVFDPPRQPRRR